MVGKLKKVSVEARIVDVYVFPAVMPLDRTNIYTRTDNGYMLPVVVLGNDAIEFAGRIVKLPREFGSVEELVQWLNGKTVEIVFDLERLETRYVLRW